MNGRSRLSIVALTACAVLGLGAVVASAAMDSSDEPETLLPTVGPTDIPSIPGISPLPTLPPLTPTPTPTATQSPTPSPTGSPSGEPTGEPTEPAALPPPPFVPSIPSFEPITRPTPSPRPAPSPRPTTGLSLGQTLPAAYGVTSAGLVAVAVALPASLAFMRPRRMRRIGRGVAALRVGAGATASGQQMKEDPMPQTRRWRLLGGLACMAAAAAAAIFGYLKISLEPLITRQVPYLASAGLATLILAVAGGALLMADQIRTEDERVEEIERSVGRLAEIIRPMIEEPARVASGQPDTGAPPPPASPERAAR